MTRTEEETEAAGELLGRRLLADDVVYLAGDLGSGKTCFARGLARGAGALSREVASPTFSIVNEYCAAGGAIVLRHLDLYRVKDTLEDLEAIGLPGAVAGTPVAVEWPGAAIARVLPATLEVTIAPQGPDTRRIRIQRR